MVPGTSTALYLETYMEWNTRKFQIYNNDFWSIW
jgi:hypothetical protein